MTNAAIQRLIDQADIERVLYDYAAAIDGRDYARLRQLLHDEVLFGLRPGGEVEFAGLGPEPVPLRAEAFIERNRTLFIGFAGTHHQVTNVRVDVEGDTARVAAYLQATHFVTGDPQTEYTFGAGYANTLIRTASGWKLTRIDITMHWQRGDATVTERARRIGMAAQATD